MINWFFCCWNKKKEEKIFMNYENFPIFTPNINVDEVF